MLRQLIGLPLADRLIAISDEEAARNVRNAMMRASDADGRELAMVGAEIGFASGEPGSTEAAFAAIAAGNDGLSARALKRSIELRLDRGEPVGEKLIETAAALAFEHQSDPLGPQFLHLEIVARSADGDFHGAFESFRRWREEAPEADKTQTAREIVTRLTERADDRTFLSGYFGQQELIEDAGTDGPLRIGLARRLNDLGFGQEAKAVLAGVAVLSVDDRLELARAALLLFEPQAALEALGTVEGERADGLRIDALGMLGRHDRGDSTLSGIGEIDRANASAVLADKGDAAERGGIAAPGTSQGATVARNGGPPGVGNPASLAASRSVLEGSAALRMRLDALLGAREGAAQSAKTN